MSRRIFCGRNAANTLCLGAFTAMLLGCDAIEKKASDFIETVKPYVALNAYDQYACNRDETLKEMKERAFIDFAGEENWNLTMAALQAEDPVQFVRLKAALDKLRLRDGRQVKEVVRNGRKVKYCYAKFFEKDIPGELKGKGFEFEGMPFLPVCTAIAETKDRDMVRIKSIADCDNGSLIPRDDLALLMRAAKSKAKPKAEPEVPDEEVELE